MMKSTTNDLLTLGGLIGCCAAGIQIAQLVHGDAVPDLANYAVTAATSLTGLGLTGVSWWQRRRPSDSADEDRVLTPAVDRLFAHFPDEEAAKESVRVVARAVTERRYRQKAKG